MNKNKVKGQHIKVYVRVRPLNDAETRRGSSDVVQCPNNREVVVNERPSDKITKKFTFDKVFGPTSKQIDVYKDVAGPLINEVLNGYNCTIFAYGQTGTGKTYTMEGGRCENQKVNWKNDPHAGIIPRAVCHLFDELRLLNVEYSVKASFLEIYNEELFDLLSAVDDTNKLRLFEDAVKKGAVIVSGLDEIAVRDKEQVHAILSRGSRKRQTAATLMNAMSSRSHTVFSVTVRIKENGVEDEVLRTGKLNLVDLAGSENIGRSGAVEKRAREAGNINQSLLTLGRVITALVEKTPHIPYRESKLTRLLQESLGGRTKTCIIATISPSQCNLEETLSTLDYAHRARNIQNKPEVNEKIGKVALIQEYIEEIHRLKADLTATREKNGVWLAEETHSGMVNQIESQKLELSELLGNVKSVTETLERKEELNKELSESLEKYLQDLNITREELGRTKEDRDEHAFLLQHRVRTEQQLAEQAESLLSVANRATNDTHLLHETLNRKRSLEEDNVAACKNLTNMCKQTLSSMKESSSNFEERSLKSKAELINMLGSGYAQAEARAELMKENLDYALRTREEIIQEIKVLNENLMLQTTRKVDTAISENTLSFRQHLQNMSEFLDAVVSKFEVVSKAVDESKKLSQAFITNLATKIEEQEMFTQQFFNFSNEQFDVLSEGMKKQENFLTNLNTTVAHLKDHDSNLDMNIKMVLQGLEGIQNRRSSIKCEVENISTELSTVNLPTSNLKKLKSRAGEMKNTLESHKNDLQIIISGHNDMSLPVIKEMELVCSDTCGVIENQKSNFPDMQKQYSQDLCRNVNAINEDVGQFNHQLKLRVEDLCSHGNECSVSQKNNIQENLREQLNVVQGCKSEMESAMDCDRAWNQIVSYNANECGTVLEKLITEGIRRDVSSGMTPQRCEFAYPRYLVTTSPHDRILSRYRRAKTEETQLVQDLTSHSDESSHEDTHSATSSEVDDGLLASSSTSASSVHSIHDSTGENDPCIPSAVVDKENTDLLPSKTDARFKKVTRKVLTEHNE